jgi:hypothetical protein
MIFTPIVQRLAGFMCRALFAEEFPSRANSSILWNPCSIKQLYVTDESVEVDALKKRKWVILAYTQVSIQPGVVVMGLSDPNPHHALKDIEEALKIRDQARMQMGRIRRYLSSLLHSDNATRKIKALRQQLHCEQPE